MAPPVLRWVFSWSIPGGCCSIQIHDLFYLCSQGWAPSCSWHSSRKEPRAPAAPVPPQQPGKTHVCAADPLQQQTGHLCLTVELGLREPQLVFCLRNRTGCSGQHTARTPLLPLPGRGNTHLLHHHPPSALSVLLAPWGPREAGTRSTRHETPWVRVPAASLYLNVIPA